VPQEVSPDDTAESAHTDYYDNTRKHRHRLAGAVRKSRAHISIYREKGIYQYPNAKGQGPITKILHPFIPAQGDSCGKGAPDKGTDDRGKGHTGEDFPYYAET
jgi:hypothetical protein